MSTEMIHVTESSKINSFFSRNNINISQDSSHNAITLVDDTTGETITLWAESNYSVASGIPGIYVEEEVS